MISLRNKALLASASVIALAATSTHAVASSYFSRTATFPVFLNLGDGVDATTETVAEIVTVTPDGMTLVYTDSPGNRIGMVDISDPAAPAPAGSVDLDGEPTAIVVAGMVALVGVNTSESYTDPSGHVAVIDLASLAIIGRCDVNGQPDSLAVSPNGTHLAVAVENERDEDLNDGVIPQLPAGHLALFELGEDGPPLNCEFASIVPLTGLAAVAGDDPEPEFVDFNSAGEVVVTLQENNHIVVVNAATREVVAHFSAGAVDLEAIDTIEDDVITANSSLAGVVREPDAVGWLDDDRFVTANEGDYEGGSRGFTIFDKSGEVLFESGNAVEHLAISLGHYPESRSENKGAEPEGIEVGRFGDRTLFFVGLERSSLVLVYEDMGPGAEPQFVQALPSAIGPEGLLAIPERNLLVVASEVDEEDNGLRGTLGIYTLDAEAPSYPHIVSAADPQTGGPIGWGALSALAADPNDPARLYTVNDSYYGQSSIMTVDISKNPAEITGRLVLMRDGEPANYDLEGVAVRAGGGFWAVSEGNPENENPQQQKSLLLAIAADGTVEAEIELPASVYEQAIRFGFEGVAAHGEGDAERVIVAFQRAWKDDPENTAKLGIYTPASETWGFVSYPLEAPKSPRGGWVGLSEITHLGEERFALIERDNQPGSYAVIKTVTIIDLAGVEPAAEGELPVVAKTLAIDLLPVMQATAGWISDKPEGFTVSADGRVFMVTDNDGVDDSSGETMLIELGTRDALLK